MIDQKNHGHLCSKKPDEIEKEYQRSKRIILENFGDTSILPSIIDNSSGK